jgi:hypothetical protein
MTGGLLLYRLLRDDWPDCA